MKKIINFISKIIYLFFTGKIEELKIQLYYGIIRPLDKIRVKKIFKSISKELLSDQKDYRLIVYKNFEYKYSKFRETFKKHGSNKGGEWKHRKNIIRSFYADFYEENIGNKNIKNILEIGIGHSSSSAGSSLRSWKELYPNANIYGADIEKKVLFQEERIKTYFTDQLDKKTLKDLKQSLNSKKFDLIVDDGLHTFEANINTFEELFPLLETDGLFFIEDIIFPELKKYYNYFNNKHNFKVVEALNVNETWGNCMVIIKK